MSESKCPKCGESFLFKSETGTDCWECLSVEKDGEFTQSIECQRNALITENTRLKLIEDAARAYMDGIDDKRLYVGRNQKRLRELLNPQEKTQ